MVENSPLQYPGSFQGILFFISLNNCFLVFLRDEYFFKHYFFIIITYKTSSKLTLLRKFSVFILSLLRLRRRGDILFLINVSMSKVS